MVKHGPHAMLETTLEQRLEASVDPKLGSYWDEVIKTGILPAEAESEGLSPEQSSWYVDFIRRLIRKALRTLRFNTRGEVYYMGAGTGEILRAVTLEANSFGRDVCAFDASTIGLQNAEQVFGRLASHPNHRCENRAFLADIEAACDPEVMFSADLLCLLRVVTALTKPLEKIGKPDPEKPRRLCEKIGRSLTHLKVLYVGPEPEFNQGVEFRNNEPLPVSGIAEWMEVGYRKLKRDGRVVAVPLGMHSLCRHRYTAALLEGW